MCIVCLCHDVCVATLSRKRKPRRCTWKPPEDEQELYAELSRHPLGVFQVRLLLSLFVCLFVVVVVVVVVIIVVVALLLAVVVVVVGFVVVCLFVVVVVVQVVCCCFCCCCVDAC